MQRILFVYRNPTSFIKQDLDILEESFQVESFRIKGPIQHLRLWFAIVRNDLVFIWFGNYWAFFATLFANILGKPSIIVAGGYDSVYIPEIKYGLMEHPILGPLARRAFQQATGVTVFSKDGQKNLLRYAGVTSKLIYCGVDVGKFKPLGTKEKRVVTVASIKSENVKRKGLEYFVLAARSMPEIPFYVIGPYNPTAYRNLKSTASDNVEFLGFLPEPELIQFLQRSSIYVQASWHEGFGLALAEAMACGCFPVTTRVGSLPEVVGDCGIYVEVADAASLANGIRQALNGPISIAPSEQIVDNYPIEKRARDLTDFVTQVAEQ